MEENLSGQKINFVNRKSWEHLVFFLFKNWYWVSQITFISQLCQYPKPHHLKKHY